MAPLVAFCCAASVRAAEPINAMCPVMTTEKTDPAITVEYQGKTIGFCCDRCVKKFNADPERYLANIPELAAAMPVRQETAASASPPAPFFGRLHPVLVHFPLAGVPLALLGWFVNAATRGRSFPKADVLPLLVGTAFAVAAYFTGRVAKDAGQFGADMQIIADRHETTSLVIMLLCIALTGLRLIQWRMSNRLWRGVYTIGLVAATGLLGFTGYLGGSLVYGPDHLAW
jgi:uncharacterized membrane protein/YHS domain-containing protein